MNIECTSRALDDQGEAMDDEGAAAGEPGADEDELFRRLTEMLSPQHNPPASVTELAEPAAVGLPAVLKHLRILEDGGIVVSEKTGRVRTYRMRPDAFDPISDWVETRKAEMHAGFDRLAAAMASLPEEK